MSYQAQIDSNRLGARITKAQIADRRKTYYVDSLLRILPYRTEDAAYYTLNGALVALPAVSTSGGADGQVYHVTRGTATRNVSPTAVEVASPVVGDTAIVQLSSGVIEHWKMTVGGWVNSLDDVAIPGVYTSLPSLTDFDVGDSVWLIDQAVSSDNGMYQKRQVSVGVFSWVQALVSGSGGGGGGSTLTPVSGWADPTSPLGSTTDRSLDTGTLSDIEAVLARLIRDLKTAGVLTT